MSYCNNVVKIARNHNISCTFAGIADSGCVMLNNEVAVEQVLCRKHELIQFFKINQKQ